MDVVYREKLCCDEIRKLLSNDIPELVGLARMDRPEPSGYILFDADHGSTNNIYVAFGVAVFFAVLTNRTLIIPPAQPIWLVDWGPLGIQQGIGHSVPTTTTEFADVFDLSNTTGLGKFCETITFREFVYREREKLSLPWSGRSDETYSRKVYDLLTMTVQGQRLARQYAQLGIASKRGTFFLQRAAALAADRSRPQGTDWPTYAGETFWTPSSATVQGVTPTLLKASKEPVLFFPMDPHFGTGERRYPRLFRAASAFSAASAQQIQGGLPWIWGSVGKKILISDQNWRGRLGRSVKALWFRRMLNSAESRLWHQVQHPQVLHFRPESYAKSGVAIDRMLDGIGRFIAIHFRSEEFDKRQCHSNQRIINFLVAMRKQYSLSETYPLFVATDSPQWFDKNAFSYSGIKVVFWQDILQTVPFASSKHDAILEQLICGFSALFIGTGGSTFTSQVIKFRERLMERPSVLLPGTEFIDP